jgi:hypothetical protein
MMTRSQKNAYAEAHAQPSASNRPNNGRRFVTRPAGSAFAIYLTVRVPVMAGIGWTRQMNV